MECWEYYHKDWSLGDGPWEVGDIVSRNGSDEQIIESIDYPYMLLEVRCIKEDVYGVFKVGDLESNLIRRYERIRKAKDNADNQ